VPPLPDAQRPRLQQLWLQVIGRTVTRRDSAHGPDHWARVERNGLYVAARTQADPLVISLFALFHDSCRVNDHLDPGHGRRGGELAATMRSDLDLIDDQQFELLVEACNGHTDQRHHIDPTVGACWDADRLDLGRVGIQPQAKFFNSEPAIRIVSQGELAVLDQYPPREV
jgi:uncharacterized protein